MIGYHATTKKQKALILKNGFSIEKQGENGSHLGNGIYIASTRSLAKQYGTYVLEIEFNDSDLYHLENWIPEYKRRCEESYKNGTPENEVNKVVGDEYKEEFTSKGYKGLIMDCINGVSKEIVIFDESIITSIN